MEKINAENFNMEEKQLIISAILNFSDGGHPVPTLDNLKYFQTAYLKNLLKKATSQITPEYQPLLLGIIKKLKT